MWLIIIYLLKAIWSFLNCVLTTYKPVFQMFYIIIRGSYNQ